MFSIWELNLSAAALVFLSGPNAGADDELVGACFICWLCKG
jgi:hypothetical protein